MKKTIFKNIKSIISKALFIEIPHSLPRFTNNNTKKNLVLIIPADPGNPGGSLGDIAMISGLICKLSKFEPDLRYITITNTIDTFSVPFHGKMECSPAWLGMRGTLNFMRLTKDCKYLFGIGADVLDGKYSESFTYRFVKYLNFANRKSILTTKTGFSFNKTPSKVAVRALSRISQGISVNVRDEYSRVRFFERTKIESSLCADIAFLMPPENNLDSETQNWLATQKGNIIGLNLNLHALDSVIKLMGISKFSSTFTEKLINLAERTNSSILLIPHDAKETSGDATILEEIKKQITEFSKINTTI